MIGSLAITGIGMFVPSVPSLRVSLPPSLGARPELSPSDSRPSSPHGRCFQERWSAGCFDGKTRPKNIRVPTVFFILQHRTVFVQIPPEVAAAAARRTNEPPRCLEKTKKKRTDSLKPLGYRRSVAERWLSFWRTVVKGRKKNTEILKEIAYF